MDKEKDDNRPISLTEITIKGSNEFLKPYGNPIKDKLLERDKDNKYVNVNEKGFLNLKKLSAPYTGHPTWATLWGESAQIIKITYRDSQHNKKIKRDFTFAEFIKLGSRRQIPLSEILENPTP